MKTFLRNAVDSYFDIDARWAFALICLLFCLSTLFQNYFILTDDVILSSTSEQIAMDKIKEMLDAQKKFAWLSYAIIPFATIIQISLIVFCLNIGTLLRGDKVQFKELFALVIKVTLLPAFLKVILVFSIVIFYNIKTVEDLSHVLTFSFINFFDSNTLPIWLHYPLASINLVELIFWLLLARGIQFILKLDFRNSIAFVSYTYGIGFAMWILIFIFLQVSSM